MSLTVQGSLWHLPDLDRTEPPVRKAPGAARVLLPYWTVALALTGAIHLDLLPVRHWLKALAPPASALDVPGPPQAPVPVVAAAPLPAMASELEPPATEAAAPLPAPFEPEAPATTPERIADPVAAQPPPPIVRPVPVARRAPAARSEPRRPPEPLARVIDEPSPAPPALASRPEPAPKPALASFAKSKGSAGGGLSCEAALASYRETLDPSHPPDLSAADYAGVLNNGRYFAHCGVPASMAVNICVAVQNGRVKGVTVRTSPASGAKQRCIARAVRGLSFPSHPRMDVARAQFR